jgi:hypothetical protein
MLKRSEIKLWRNGYIKDEWGHFDNKILMIKIANIRNKSLLKKMGGFLFKIYEKRKKAINKLKV